MNHHVTLFFMFAKLKSTSKIKNYSEVKLDYRLCKLDKKNWWRIVSVLLLFPIREQIFFFLEESFCLFPPPSSD